MKALPILILGTIVLFLAALIAPRRSKRLQRWIKDRLQKGKRKVNRKAGVIGDWTAKSLDWSQNWVDTVMSGGRKTRDKLPGDEGS
jgi:gas vesicle protein